MRFRLRTLLIVLALGPPALAGAWFAASPSASILAHVTRADWEEWQPLLQLIVGLSTSVILVTVAVALARRAGGST